MDDPARSSPAPVVVGLAALALASGLAVWLFGAPSGPAAPKPVDAAEPATRPASAANLEAPETGYHGMPALPFLTNKKSDRPLHTKSRYPPGTRIPVRIAERPKSGIPCPDGTFLPFLNGMTAAPAVQRDPAYGPVPPIVGIVVDADGIEWWEHADGSTTTCHYIGVTAHGENYFDPTTRHALPKPSSQILSTEQGVAPGEPTKGK